ncbi:MAG: YicC/YloC family endoribonuclease, partial [Ruminiclostridium sp.]
MIRSMIGFGREQAVINGREIIVEIRSVNHKFFEFSA